MGERRRKAVENVVGGALGFAVGVVVMGLGMKALEAVGADPLVFVVVLATAGGGFAYGCVQAGIAAVEAVSLYDRARRHLRAGRWEELAPLLRRLLEWDELFPGFDHPRTVTRRRALISVLARLDRFAEAGLIAERNIGSLSRRLGATHPDTAEARDVARLLREAALDPSVAEVVREAMRART
ncbi:hypothetical protein K1T35_07910 [Pseudonocardia sp. DSM 110487]|uniref:hypothetical protein n=1 Tax=Pseudonocardia sp. DSM 110487 TaxID=2865833 RepID=UPI001C69836B|nr:hypothetical protein [Pseudonocardia sp. DSM 110487]QYN37158.1 hypothetical protein K1T35_07910 [Pseudonocardia sp. DSM 110487]